MPLLLQDWQFCGKADCRDPDLASGLHDPFAARRWLEYKTDVLNLLAMRTLLLQEGRGWDLSRMSDDDVIDQITRLLVSGRLHVHVRQIPLGNGVLAAQKTDKPFVPFPISERKPAVAKAAPPKPVDPPTFPPDADFASQAAALSAAASAGVAACYL